MTKQAADAVYAASEEQRKMAFSDMVLVLRELHDAGVFDDPERYGPRAAKACQAAIELRRRVDMESIRMIESQMEAAMRPRVTLKAVNEALATAGVSLSFASAGRHHYAFHGAGIKSPGAGLIKARINDFTVAEWVAKGAALLAKGKR